MALPGPARSWIFWAWPARRTVGPHRSGTASLLYAHDIRPPSPPLSPDMSDLAAAVMLGLMGGWGVVFGVGAWTGRYRGWTEEKWWYGRSVTYLIPGGAGALFGALAITLHHTPLAAAAKPTASVSGVLFALCVGLFFTQPNWALPPWLRDPTSDDRVGTWVSLAFLGFLGLAVLLILLNPPGHH